MEPNDGVPGSTAEGANSLYVGVGLGDGDGQGEASGTLKFSTSIKRMLCILSATISLACCISTVVRELSLLAVSVFILWSIFFSTFYAYLYFVEGCQAPCRS